VPVHRRAQRTRLGDLVFKPRGQWHTFWLREDDLLAQLSAQVDPESVADLVEGHGLRFGGAE